MSQAGAPGGRYGSPFALVSRNTVDQHAAVDERPVVRGVVDAQKRLQLAQVQPRARVEAQALAHGHHVLFRLLDFLLGGRVEQQLRRAGVGVGVGQ